MIRKGFLLLLTVSFLFLYSTKAYGDTKFDTAATVTYAVDSAGTTQVTEHFAITNRTEFYYTPTYLVNLGVDDAQEIVVKGPSGGLSFEKNEGERGELITITFPKRVVGKGKKNTFTVTYSTHKIAKKLGNIWEISIPGLAKPEVISKYTATLLYPAAFGTPSIKKGGGELYSGKAVFLKKDLGKSGAMLIFGNEQYYTLHLSYHISNKNLFPIKSEIALPPSTDYQEVIISNVSEKPVNMYKDADGNWLAQYTLAPQEQKTIQIEELVKVYTQALKTSISEAQKKLYTKNQPYWESSNPQIKKIASSLNTSRQIYDFVVNNLGYNYKKSSDETVRLGAVKTINNPKDSVCLEFTDLFVAIARAKEIPAREIEGYAYTRNDTLRPVSLVKDVLHAWPEYYDINKQQWVMVDPTWGNTTLGLDYFSSLDLSHIAFVVKGSDSTYPIPAGGYKFSKDSKDVMVNFLEPAKFTDNSKQNFSFSFSRHAFSGFPISSYLTIRNNTGSEINGKYIVIDSELSPKKHSIYIDSLLPFQRKTYQISYDRTPILTNRDYTVTIHFDGRSYRKELFVNLIPNMVWVGIGGIFLAACIILSGFAYKTWCLLIQKRKK